MEQEKKLVDGLFDVDPYKRELPNWFGPHGIIFEVLPSKKDYRFRPVDQCDGFIASGKPSTYQQFFELLGWWAVEKIDIQRVDYGWPDGPMDFFEFVHWSLHKNDKTGDEHMDSYHQRHYLPNGVVGLCTGNFDRNGHLCDKKHDLVIIVRLNRVTLEEFDKAYAEYDKARRAYLDAKYKKQ